MSKFIKVNKSAKARSVELWHPDRGFDITAKERDIIRHNWSKLGYKYWFSEWGVERWKHPETKHVVTLPN